MINHKFNGDIVFWMILAKNAQLSSLPPSSSI